MRSRSTGFSAPLQSSGFSLLEVLVALAILGIAVVSIFQLFSIGLRSTKQAEDYTKALFYARSIMDAAYCVPDIEKSIDNPEMDDGFDAKKDVTVISASEDETVKLYQITVTVTWPPSGSLTLKGLRTVYETD